jgi:hypothetical protein
VGAKLLIVNLIFMIENLNKYSISKDGTVQNKKSGKVIKPFYSKGYPIVSLSDDNAKQKNCLVHRLVAFVHLPNPENKPVVNHKDGNPLNCNVDNLEWCTQKENIFHSRKLTGHGSVISKKKLIELYKNNLDMDLKSFLELALQNCK